MKFDELPEGKITLIEPVAPLEFKPISHEGTPPGTLTPPKLTCAGKSTMGRYEAIEAATGRRVILTLSRRVVDQMRKQFKDRPVILEE